MRKLFVALFVVALLPIIASYAQTESGTSVNDSSILLNVHHASSTPIPKSIGIVADMGYFTGNLATAQAVAPYVNYGNYSQAGNPTPEAEVIHNAGIKLIQPIAPNQMCYPSTSHGVPNGCPDIPGAFEQNSTSFIECDGTTTPIVGNTDYSSSDFFVYGDPASTLLSTSTNADVTKYGFVGTSYLDTYWLQGAMFPYDYGIDDNNANIFASCVAPTPAPSSTPTTGKWAVNDWEYVDYGSNPVYTGFGSLVGYVTYVDASTGTGGHGNFDVKNQAPSIQTMGYFDAQRICDLDSGGCSERPDISALSTSADLMQCGSGAGPFHTDYDPNTGTYYGDPTSSNLANTTNSSINVYISNYGPTDIVWMDDQMTLSDEYFQTAVCGTNSPVLTGNGDGNASQPGGYGASYTYYHGGTQYTDANFLANLGAFDNQLERPVMAEGLCNNLSEESGSPSTTRPLFSGGYSNVWGTLCEAWAEGFNTSVDYGSTGKMVGQEMIFNLQDELYVQESGKHFAILFYAGDAGNASDARDEVGYAHTLLMLGYDPNLTVENSEPWGNTNSGSGSQLTASTNALELLVPGTPVQSVTNWNTLTPIQLGSIYRREFTNCYYAGQPIGDCAFIANPSSSTYSVGSLTNASSYHYSIQVNYSTGMLNGQYGTPNLGDAQNLLTFNSASPPTSIGPAGWDILVQSTPNPNGGPVGGPGGGGGSTSTPTPGPANPNLWQFADGTQYSDQVWVTREQTLIANAAKPAWISGDCGYGDGSTAFNVYTGFTNSDYDPSPALMAASNATNLSGVVCDFMFEGFADEQLYGKVGGGSKPHKWYSEENAALLVDSFNGPQLIANWYPGQGICSTVVNPTCSSLNAYDQRGFVFASLMLTYQPGITSEWVRPYGAGATFPASNVGAEQEDFLVPTTPAQTAVWPTRIQNSTLATSTGAYRREFGACYIAGIAIGRCAFVVNPTNATVSMPPASAWQQTYGHYLTLSGDGAFSPAMSSAYGLPNLGDNGSFTSTAGSPTSITTIGALGWYIFVP